MLDEPTKRQSTTTNAALLFHAVHFEPMRATGMGAQLEFASAEQPQQKSDNASDITDILGFDQPNAQPPQPGEKPVPPVVQQQPSDAPLRPGFLRGGLRTDGAPPAQPQPAERPAPVQPTPPSAPLQPGFLRGRLGTEILPPQPPLQSPIQPQTQLSTSPSLSDLVKTLAPPPVLVPLLEPRKEGNQFGTHYLPPNDPHAQLLINNRESIVKIRADDGNGGGGEGSGFFVSADGMVATAHHVVKGARNLVVTTSNGERHAATVESIGPTRDIALIRVYPSIPGEQFRPMPIANTDSVKPGDSLAALGHPNGWNQTFVSPGSYKQPVTYGDITYPFNSAGLNPQATAYTAEMHVDHGNSGAPIVNERGEVVGIATHSNLYDRTFFTGTDGLNRLLGRETDVRTRDYFLPSQLHFGSHTTWLTATTAESTLSLLARISQRTRPLTGWAILTPIVVGTDTLFRDIPYAKQAFAHGTTAERINAGINLTGDALALGGFALARFGAPTWGAAAMLTGTGLKTVNDILAYRQY